MQVEWLMHASYCHRSECVSYCAQLQVRVLVIELGSIASSLATMQVRVLGFGFVLTSILILIDIDSKCESLRGFCFRLFHLKHVQQIVVILGVVGRS